MASKRFEGQAETEQDPYADDYFFYRYDVRGSVTNIVDGAGSVVKSYDYDEFGVTTSTGDSFFNEVTFTGSVADASGLLYMNARYYNPATARFLSQDTYTGSASVPWTQHLYAYCNNNPVNMVDPTGHMAGRPNTFYIDDESMGVWNDGMAVNVTPHANGETQRDIDLVSLLSKIDLRVEQTASIDDIGLPGVFELSRTTVAGHSNIYDKDGIFPIIGTTDKSLFGGVGVYSHKHIMALTMSKGKLSLEMGYGNASVGMTIVASEPFKAGGMWGIEVDYTQYTGQGNYIRTTYAMKVNPWFAAATIAFALSGVPVPALG